MKSLSGTRWPQYSAFCSDSTVRLSEARRRHAKTTIVTLSRVAPGANSSASQMLRSTGTGSDGATLAVEAAALLEVLNKLSVDAASGWSAAESNRARMLVALRI